MGWGTSFYGPTNYPKSLLHVSVSPGVMHLASKSHFLTAFYLILGPIFKYLVGGPRDIQILVPLERSHFLLSKTSNFVTSRYKSKSYRFYKLCDSHFFAPKDDFSPNFAKLIPVNLNMFWQYRLL